MLQWINALYSISFSLTGLVFTMSINAKATPINDTDYNYYTTAVEL